MNSVDVLIILIVAAAVLHGVLLGAAVQALSFRGFWLGLAAGAAAAPIISGLSDEPTAKPSGESHGRRRERGRSRPASLG